jgi:hypothetical protein
MARDSVVHRWRVTARVILGLALLSGVLLLSLYAAVQLVAGS